ncbi:MAG TPA: ribosome recycling factor [Anaerolineae bacterium]|nr:ribosome recycling factor [Anaerolineae bacterium]
MINEILNDAKERMKGSISALESDLAGFRTGRASPALLDQLTVEMYGMEMSIKKLALVSAPEPQQLAVRPFDINSISAIERAILKSDLGLTPNNDGKIIRLNIPRLTEERRRSLSRLIGARIEEGKVSVRNVRRDALNDLRELKDEKLCTEDEFFAAQEDLQKITDEYTAKVDELGKEKQDEIMEV